MYKKMMTKIKFYEVYSNGCTLYVQYSTTQFTYSKRFFYNTQKFYFSNTTVTVLNR